MAVGRLFEEHGARLYRLGVRFCGNADEAHDLVQERATVSSTPIDPGSGTSREFRVSHPLKAANVAARGRTCLAA